MNQAYCKSCKKPIVWLRCLNHKTNQWRWMPVNPQEALDEEVFDAKKHESHYATCPQAKTWRGRPKPTPGGVRLKSYLEKHEKE